MRKGTGGPRLSFPRVHSLLKAQGFNFQPTGPPERGPDPRCEHHDLTRAAGGRRSFHRVSGKGGGRETAESELRIGSNPHCNVDLQKNTGPSKDRFNWEASPSKTPPPPQMGSKKPRTFHSRASGLGPRQSATELFSFQLGSGPLGSCQHGLPRPKKKRLRSAPCIIKGAIQKHRRFKPHQGFEAAARRALEPHPSS